MSQLELTDALTLGEYRQVYREYREYRQVYREYVPNGKYNLTIYIEISLFVSQTSIYQICCYKITIAKIFVLRVEMYKPCSAIYRTTLFTTLSLTPTLILYFIQYYTIDFTEVLSSFRGS